MSEKTIQLFDGKEVRHVWDEQSERWYFSIVDVIAVLTESTNPQAYWRKLKQRLKEEGNETVTNCHGLKMQAPDGKRRLTDVADIEQLFRLIQSIPSPKAEPLKMWLAEVGSKRIDQLIDPELAVQQAVEDYRRKGYSEEWINNRMRSIEVRNALTDEWKRVGITQKKDYAILTNILTQAWSGKSVKKYKEYKGVHQKSNLRDNMTPMELTLNMLAEVTTKEFSEESNPQTLQESMHIAKEGGDVAKEARKQIEKRLGRSVVSPLNAKDQINGTIEIDTEEVQRLEDKIKGK